MKTEESDVRVLVAGMDTNDNQFTRGVERAGCQPIHWSGLKGTFPRDCDAVVFVNANLGHIAQWQIKEAYKTRPMFFAGRGFSDIKDEFEQFVESRRSHTMTQFNQPKMVKAVPPPTPIPRPVEPVPPPATVASDAVTKKRIINTKEKMEKIYAAVRECLAADMQVADVETWLRENKLFKGDGSPYTRNEVHALIARVNNRSTPEPAPLPMAALSPNIPSMVKAIQACATLTDKQKLELIGQVIDGRVNAIEHTEASVTMLNTSTQPQLHLSVRNILKPGSKAHVYLSKAQAELVIKSSEALIRFVQGEKI